MRGATCKFLGGAIQYGGRWLVRWEHAIIARNDNSYQN